MIIGLTWRQHLSLYSSKARKTHPKYWCKSVAAVSKNKDLLMRLHSQSRRNNQTGSTMVKAIQGSSWDAFAIMNVTEMGRMYWFWRWNQRCCIVKWVQHIAQRSSSKCLWKPIWKPITSTDHWICWYCIMRRNVIEDRQFLGQRLLAQFGVNSRVDGTT